MYFGIQSLGGIKNPMSTLAIVYFVALVIVGNCIFCSMWCVLYAIKRLIFLLFSLEFQFT